MLREIIFLNKFLNFKGLIFNYHLKKFYAKEKKNEYDICDFSMILGS